jgi:hypothetical protein
LNNKEFAARRDVIVGIAGSCDFVVGSSVRHSADEECGGRQLGAFEVGRVLPAAKRRMIGPFIFFDHMGPVDLRKGLPRKLDGCASTSAYRPLNSDLFVRR